MMDSKYIHTDKDDNAGLIAFTGRHGTGKTTMIEHFAATNPFPDVKVHVARSQAKNVHNGYGVCIQDPLSYEKRLTIQEDILSSWISEIRKCLDRCDPDYKNIILTDRSPVDIAAYLLVDYTRGISKDLEDRTQIFVDTALKCAKKRIITSHIYYRYTFDIQERDFANIFNTTYLAIHNRMLRKLHEDQGMTHVLSRIIAAESFQYSFMDDGLEPDTDMCSFIFNKRYMELLSTIQRVFYPNLTWLMDYNSSKS